MRNVGSERYRFIRLTNLFHLEIYSAGNIDLAAGNADINRHTGAEFKRRLDPFYSVKADLDSKEASAADGKNRKQERFFPLAEIKPYPGRVTRKGYGKFNPSDMF
jgi:hypothetical protein